MDADGHAQGSAPALNFGAPSLLPGAVPAASSPGFAGGAPVYEAPPAPPTGAPRVPHSTSRLIVEPLVLDLGEIEQQQYPLEFRYRVDGSEPILIQDLQPSCGCTEAHLESGGKTLALDQPLAAGSEGLVAGVFDASKYRNEKNTSIRILGNQANGTVDISIHAHITPTFLLRPQVVRFGELAQARVAAGLVEARVRVQAAQAFTVERWVDLPEGVRVEDAGELERDEAQSRYVHELVVHITADAPAGLIFGTAVAETSLGRLLEVTIQATVLGPVQYTPAGRLQFGLRSPEEPATLSVRVQAAEGVTLPVPALHLEGDAAYSAAVRELQPGRTLQVDVTLSAAEAGAHGATLRLEYPAASGLPAHEIRLSATVKERP